MGVVQRHIMSYNVSYVNVNFGGFEP